MQLCLEVWGTDYEKVKDICIHAEELGRNFFRHYFARYNRLLIQQCLIKSAYDESFIPEELERLHNLDFLNKVKRKYLFEDFSYNSHR